MAARDARVHLPDALRIASTGRFDNGRLPDQETKASNNLAPIPPQRYREEATRGPGVLDVSSAQARVAFSGELWMAIKTSKPEMLENLRVMLRDVLALRASGAAYAKLSRAHGYVDGYMRVLLETGVATKSELLALVSDERSRSDGPATRSIDEDIAAVA
jgi:hypothetical protein